MTFRKDPDAVLDYLWDWTSWLQTGETITTSTFIVPSGITKNSDTNTATTCTIWLSGGTIGATYKITNRIVTSAGRTNDRSTMFVINDQ